MGMEQNQLESRELKLILFPSNERTTGQVGTIAMFVLSFILVIVSILYHHGGIIHPESHSYLPYYLSDKPLINKLYDSRILDQDMYQARELSYLFDYLDSKFIEWSISKGHPHFLSATTYIFLFITGMLIWRFSTIKLQLSSVFGTSFVLLFWTSPSIFLPGNFFRSAKVGVALLVTLLFMAIYDFVISTDQVNEQATSFQPWLVFFLLSLGMALFDRQGVYFAAMALTFFMFWSLFFPNKRMLIPISALAGALLLGHFYNRQIGPFLTQVLNHYSPNFTYQMIPLWKPLQHPAVYAWAGTSLYLDNLRFLLGNIPALLLGACLLILIIILGYKLTRDIKSSRRLSRVTVTGLGLFLCMVVLLIGLDALMVLRHTPIFDADIRRGYYWIPQVALLTLTVALCTSYLIKRFPSSKTIIILFLFLAILGNILALPVHNQIVIQGYIKQSYEYSPRLLYALQHLASPQNEVPADVYQDPIYQWFRNSLP